jgi:hypothetical protein
MFASINKADFGGGFAGIVKHTTGFVEMRPRAMNQVKLLLMFMP